MTKRQRDLLKVVFDNPDLHMGVVDLIDEDIRWLVEIGYFRLTRTNDGSAICRITDAGSTEYMNGSKR